MVVRVRRGDRSWVLYVITGGRTTPHSRKRDAEQSRESKRNTQTLTSGSKSQFRTQTYKSALVNSLCEITLWAKKKRKRKKCLRGLDKNGQHSTKWLSTQRMKSLVKYKKANPSPVTKEHLKSQHTKKFCKLQGERKRKSTQNQVKFPRGVSAWIRNS